MPTSAIAHYGNAAVMPLYQQGLSAQQHVALVASTVYPKGTVIGEIGGASASYTITNTGASAGTFTVTVDGQTTAPQAYNVSAANLLAAIAALPAVGAGNVTASLAAAVYTVTFQGTLANTPVGLSTNGTGLTGATAAVATVSPGYTGTGTFKAYATGNSDGSQVPRAVLTYDCATDAAGLITMGPSVGADPWGQTWTSAPAYFKGVFKLEDLVFPGTALLTDNPAWHLWNGTLAGGKGVIQIG